MKKKFILPFLTLAVAAAFSLGACGGNPSSQSQQGGGNSSGEPSSEPTEVKINITSEGDKKEIIVGETLQLRADQEGVTWGTRNTDIVSVSNTGLVTALAAGSARVTAEKEGFARGSFTVTVNKAPEKAAKYTLHMEDADHYTPNEKWGMNYGGTWYGPNADGDSPIEEGGGSDGTHIGWLQQGCKETLTFTSNKAVQVEIGVSMAYNAEVNLASVLSVKFNDAAIDMTGKVCEAPEDGDTNNYYDFHTVSFGNVTLKNGNNVLEIEMIGQGPNMDDFKIYTNEDLQIAVVKPVVLPKIAITPTSVTLEIGGTQQLTSEVTGLSYTSSNAEVATVSNEGLITGVAAGSAEIVVSKEGYKDAKVAVKVKAAQVVTTYDLVENTAVRMEFENGEFYCETGKWGMDLSSWGMGWMGPSHDGGETPIEDVESASGGMSLGYFNQTSKVTLKFNSPKAGTVSLVLCGAQNGSYDLAANVTIKVNDTAVDLTGKVIESTGYTDWKTTELGSVAVQSGANTLVLEVIGQQGPNLDYIEATLA